jgi:hypothetical protein
MYVVKTIYKYEAEITAWHPCTFRKQNAPKSIELQERKHTVILVQVLSYLYFLSVKQLIRNHDYAIFLKNI